MKLNRIRNFIVIAVVVGCFSLIAFGIWNSNNHLDKCHKACAPQNVSECHDDYAMCMTATTTRVEMP